MMNKLDKNIIICPHCKAKVDLQAAHRNCGNCFSCAGCQRYNCPKCGKEIIIKELKKPSFFNEK